MKKGVLEIIRNNINNVIRKGNYSATVQCNYTLIVIKVSIMLRVVIIICTVFLFVKMKKWGRFVAFNVDLGN